MRIVTMATAVVLFLVSPVAADDYTVDDVAWMAGYWTNILGDGRKIEELWLEPGGAHMMVGLNRDTRGERVFFEHLRIEQRDGGVYFVAKPSNQPEAAFRLVEHVDGAKAVFENLEHDFPQRITYELADRELTATVSGVVRGQTKSGTFTFQRTKFDKEMK